VPRIRLPAPRTTQESFSLYRPWLLREFWDHACSYCLIRDDGVQIDHYEPRAYAPARIDDPSNLLLGCGRCNGRAGKSDYHPFHSSLDLLEACETALEWERDAVSKDERLSWTRQLELLLPHLAARWLLLHVFGVEVSPELEERLVADRERRRGPPA
jgi:hypothetical protein